MEYSSSLLSSGSKFITVLLLLVLAASTLFAERGAVVDAICDMSTEGLDACKPSVSSGSDPVDPTQECCSALAGADLPCLCSYRNSLLLPSLGIDPELAMQLPKKCGLDPPADC